MEKPLNDWLTLAQQEAPTQFGRTVTKTRFEGGTCGRGEQDGARRRAEELGVDARGGGEARAARNVRRGG